MTLFMSIQALQFRLAQSTDFDQIIKQVIHKTFILYTTRQYLSLDSMHYSNSHNDSQGRRKWQAQNINRTQNIERSEIPSPKQFRHFGNFRIEPTKTQTKISADRFVIETNLLDSGQSTFAGNMKTAKKKSSQQLLNATCFPGGNSIRSSPKNLTINFQHQNRFGERPNSLKLSQKQSKELLLHYFRPQSSIPPSQTFQKEEFANDIDYLSQLSYKQREELKMRQRDFSNIETSKASTNLQTTVKTLNNKATVIDTNSQIVYGKRLQFQENELQYQTAIPRGSVKHERSFTQNQPLSGAKAEKEFLRNTMQVDQRPLQLPKQVLQNQKQNSFQLNLNPTVANRIVPSVRTLANENQKQMMKGGSDEQKNPKKFESNSSKPKRFQNQFDWKYSKESPKHNEQKQSSAKFLNQQLKSPLKIERLQGFQKFQFSQNADSKRKKQNLQQSEQKQQTFPSLSKKYGEDRIRQVSELNESFGNSYLKGLDMNRNCNEKLESKHVQSKEPTNHKAKKSVDKKSDEYDCAFRKFDNSVQLRLLNKSLKNKSSQESETKQSPENKKSLDQIIDVSIKHSQYIKVSKQPQKGKKGDIEDLRSTVHIMQHEKNNYLQTNAFNSQTPFSNTESTNFSKLIKDQVEKPEPQPFSSKIQTSDSTKSVNTSAWKEKLLKGNQQFQQFREKQKGYIKELPKKQIFHNLEELKSNSIQKGSGQEYGKRLQQQSVEKLSPSKAKMTRMSNQNFLREKKEENPKISVAEVLLSNGVNLQKKQYKLPNPPKKKYEKKISMQLYRGQNKKSIIVNEVPTNDRENCFSNCTNKKFLIGQFQLGKIVGSGRYGDVIVSLHKSSGFLLSIKKILKGTIQEVGIVEQFINEIKLHSKLNHQNIIQLYNFFEDDYHIFILMEYADSGTLLEFMKQEQFKALSFGQKELKIAEIITQLLHALCYMHREGIIHRDIKLENILVTQNGCIKLCDFGYSTRTDLGMKKTFCGTLDYIAPEIMQKSAGYDQSVDMWAVGVLTYELFVGKGPYYDEYRKIAKQNAIRNRKQSMSSDIEEWSKMFRSAKVSYPEDISADLKAFILGLLDSNPNSRMNAFQALDHPFIRKSKKGNH